MLKNNELDFLEDLVDYITDEDMCKKLIDLVENKRNQKEKYSNQVNVRNKTTKKEQHSLNNKISYLRNKKKLTELDKIKLNEYIKRRDEIRIINKVVE